MARRRLKGEGSIYQTHGKDCPPAQPDGTRPRHTCKGRWMAYLDLGWRDGKRDRRYVTGKDAATVRKRLDELKASTAAGVRTDSRATVEKWLTYWLDEVAAPKNAASTMKTYRGYVDNWIVPALGKKRLTAVKPADVRALHRTMETAGKSGATRRQAHAILQRALEVAVDEGLVPWNAAARVDAPKADGNHHRELSTPESLKVISACQTPREWARVAVALLTGLRQGEALGLAWADVDLADGSLWVHQVAQPVPGKGVEILPRIKSGVGEERWVALLPEVVESLTRWRDERGSEGLVFADADAPGKPIRPERDHREWKALCARAEVPQVPLHGARATTATRLLELGVPLHTVADILGHADMALTLSRYTRSNLDSQRAALAALPPLPARPALGNA